MPYADPERQREYNRQWRPKPKLDEPVDDRRCVPVRLTQIDEQIRLRAAQQASVAEDDPDQKLELIYAALFPSNTVYWIAP